MMLVMVAGDNDMFEVPHRVDGLANNCKAEAARLGCGYTTLSLAQLRFAIRAILPRIKLNQRGKSQIADKFEQAFDI